MRSAPESSSLPEIEYIEMLEKIEEDYTERFGVAPFNISYWDSTDEFNNQMAGYLELPTLDALVAYRFSYQIKEINPVIVKLGGQQSVHGGLFTPSCTSSILCVLNWLKSRPKQKIVIMCPAYFSPFQAAKRFNLTVSHAFLKRHSDGFALPNANSALWREPAVLWLTNPVYGAGVYLSSEDIKFIKKLLNAGWTVIADECLALPGHELMRELGECPNFLGIYSPHKSVCINGVKFSVIIFNLKHLDFMERWADVWYGGMGYSSSVAIMHFLSENFNTYLTRFNKAIAPQRETVVQMCAENQVDIDTQAKGHFVSCYFPNISARYGNSREFLRTLVNASGASVITGNRSRFARELGFSFRINLARGGPRFQPALARIIDCVTGCSH